MFKKICSIFLAAVFALFCLQPVHAATFGDFTTTGKAFILYNLRDKQILSEENADTKLPIASLTKIMVAITILEDSDLKLNDKIIITSEMLNDLYGWSVVGLRTGQVLTVEELLYALLLPSAGDAGQALAIADSGSIANFAEKMNQKATNLGLTNSHFSNPIGRDEDNYSTARDIATLLFHALKNPTFQTIFSANSYYLSPLGITIKKTTLSYGLDVSMFSGAKTGYTDAAGRCLASTAKLNSTDYLLVTLGHNPATANHLRDSLQLYHYYDQNFSYREILKKDQEFLQIPVTDSETTMVAVTAPADFSYFMTNSYDLNNLQITLTHPESLHRYFDFSSELAHLTIQKDDETIYETSIFAVEPIAFNNHILLIIILVLASLGVACLIGFLCHKKLLGFLIFLILLVISGLYVAHFFILPEPTITTTVLQL